MAKTKERKKKPEINQSFYYMSWSVNNQEFTIQSSVWQNDLFDSLLWKTGNIFYDYDGQEVYAYRQAERKRRELNAAIKQILSH